MRPARHGGREEGARGRVEGRMLAGTGDLARGVEDAHAEELRAVLGGEKNVGALRCAKTSAR